MAVTNGYLTLEELRRAVGDDGASASDPRYESAIEAASRRIDNWCGGGRHFWSVPAPTPRVFYAVNRWLVEPGFFSTTAGLVVKTDDDNDGVFETTWAAGEWQAQPSDRPNGEAFDRLVASGLRRFPVNGRRQCVEVTAMWGWAAVPAPVREAAEILAVALYKAKDFVGGDIGFNRYGDEAADSISAAAKRLVKPYASRRGPLYQCDDDGKDAT